MAGTHRRTDDTIGERLQAEPQRFGFFQAVRLLEKMRTGGAVGGNNPPDREAVRFRSQVSLSFPPHPVVALRKGIETQGALSPRPPEMTVSFLGLHGPTGVLPRHYTAHLLERCHVRHRDYAMRDFFDLFNHRTISLFYRAWEKYRFNIDYERANRTEPSETDLFTYCLLCFVGLGTPGLQNRVGCDEQTIIYYGGHFAHRPRNASALGAILQDYFGLPTDIEQFSGRWLYLSRDDQSSLPTTRQPTGLNCELGMNVIVGERVWDVQSKFRVRVGPVTYAQFVRLMPNGDTLQPLCELARLYVGVEFDFDVQLVLAAAEVPQCQLSASGPVEPRLGWNSWLSSKAMAVDAEDAVFALSEC